ncbi:hypothetical protein ES705_36061 [subsurface metagenome]
MPEDIILLTANSVMLSATLSFNPVSLTILCFIFKGSKGTTSPSVRETLGNKFFKKPLLKPLINWCFKFQIKS